MFSMKTKFYFKLSVLQNQNGSSKEVQFQEIFPQKQGRASMEILSIFLVKYITATKLVFSDSTARE